MTTTRPRHDDSLAVTFTVAHTNDQTWVDVGWSDEDAAQAVRDESGRSFLRVLETLRAVLRRTSIDDLELRAEQLEGLPDPARPAGLGDAEAHVGPFYSTEGLARWWGITPQAVRARAKRHQILAIGFDRGRQQVYPTWQFNGGGVIAGLPPVLEALEPMGAYNTASWLRGVLDPFAPHETIEVLRNADEEDVAEVTQLAREIGQAWDR